jgi:hypothetical protein
VSSLPHPVPTRKGQPAPPALAVPADGPPEPHVRQAVGGGLFVRCPNCRSAVPVATGDDYCPRRGWVPGAPF